MIGLLMAQYTFTGYDASAHMSEETHNADIAAPRGIVSSIIISLIAGWILILAITFVIPTDPKTYATVAADTAAPVAIWTAALSRVGAELLLLIAVVAQFFCGMASTAANSRMLFAFSRDGAVPGACDTAGRGPCRRRRRAATAAATFPSRSGCRRQGPT